MKSLLITAIIVGALILKSGNAQKSNWSTGIRIGARYDNLQMQTTSEANKWNPELGIFIKRKVYRSLFAEVGLSYLYSKYQYPLIMWDTAGNMHHDGTIHSSIKIFLVNIGFTYNIIQSKRIALYTSMGIINHHSFSKSETKDSKYNFGWLTYNDPMKTRLLSTVYIGTGFNYTITPQLYLNLNTRIETQTNISSFELRMQGGPLLMPTIQIGLGYRF